MVGALSIIVALLLISLVWMIKQKSRPVGRQLEALWPVDHQCVTCGKPADLEVPMCPHCAKLIAQRKKAS